MDNQTEEIPAIGVIGGSGLYEINGLTEVEDITIETPFGNPSDAIVQGKLLGRRVCFLPRHAKGHRLLPTELNHRANIWAMRKLNVRWIIAVTAVGSLKEEYHPRDIVLPDQFYDRTSQRAHHTFFGEGIVAHVGFSDPISSSLRQLLFETATDLGKRVHNGGTYVNMDGPAFSTRAESETNRKLGFDLVGMTNLPEAKLAREAEIALATLAMITDYDCWHPDHDAVDVATVIRTLTGNAAHARDLIARLPAHLTGPRAPCPCGCDRALDHAVMTAPDRRDPALVAKLDAVAGRVLG